ncbi:P pilus assembly chaperone PapD [Litorivivens lipolytica]|uniref:P pilus assembly chaperone PapD n=1 Tax=Litorivivens lipolytica TaxID=1524264 RepID=A0A7W4Z5L6_9GAMM|nr:fimbria/pilus periplasmic chaperone [Litorivivens lipolytica]MBB3047237.1 P pilus assembly chaperone PapD [Litorivivens lipolytica]
MNGLFKYLFLALFLFAGCGSSQAQIGVPGQALTILIPQTQSRFPIKNGGEEPVVVSIDIAPRANVYENSRDGFVVIYPKTFRLEPKTSQQVSVLWRGGSAVSKYYYIRVHSVSEASLKQDRSNPKSSGVAPRVGQAFPLNIIAPDSKPNITLSLKDKKVWLSNSGTRGDHIEQIRYRSGRSETVGKFIVPGEIFHLASVATLYEVAAIKLRRSGWVDPER